jgi:replicative DNA helicase
MARIEKNTLEFLGHEYQVRLIAQLITDRKFANNIIDIINPNYFKNEDLRLIVATIKEAKETGDIIPDMGSLEFRLLKDIDSDTARRFLLAHLTQIKEATLHDTDEVQKIAMRFCKQQELIKSVEKIKKIIHDGDNYEECESILRKALEHGENKDDGLDIFENIEDVLAEDFRKPIATGIDGLDEIMNGGLSKGELAVILAPFGVGKTTMITKIANTAFNNGNKVLQIFFEDMPKVIQRKHLSCWSKIDLNDLSVHKTQLMQMVSEMTNSTKEGKGLLKLKKFSSTGTTISIIRRYIRKLIAQGFRPDIVLLDYIDCVSPSKHYDDNNVGEGATMREFETMLAELDIAGWTAVQGNRSSISATVVEANQMSGSIKKGMIGHFIVSIAKTLDQKEKGTATMAILKSRFGKDGVIFENVVFDNKCIQISMNEDSKGKTHTEHKKGIDVSNQQNLNSLLMQAAKTRTSVLSGPT